MMTVGTRMEVVRIWVLVKVTVEREALAEEEEEEEPKGRVVGKTVGVRVLSKEAAQAEAKTVTNFVA